MRIESCRRATTEAIISTSLNYLFLARIKQCFCLWIEKWPRWCCVTWRHTLGSLCKFDNCNVWLSGRVVIKSSTEFSDCLLSNVEYWYLWDHVLEHHTFLKSMRSDFFLGHKRCRSIAVCALFATTCNFSFKWYGGCGHFFKQVLFVRVESAHRLHFLNWVIKAGLESLV